MKSAFVKSAAGAALLALVALGAQAQELKIGYVNSDRVLREASMAKAAQSRLEAEVAKRDKVLADMTATLKNAAEKLEREALTLSEGDRARRERDLGDQDREIQRKRREMQEDMAQRKNDEVGAIVDRANKVIKQIFETEKYDLILQEAVFAGPRIDITDKVIKALNAQGAK
jgi:outer membrane protein